MDEWLPFLFVPLVVITWLLHARYKHQQEQLIKAGRRKAELERLKSQRETPDATP